MRFRSLLIFSGFAGCLAPALADDTLYRYEGDVSPCDESTGWVCGNPCDPPCSDSVEDGHYVLRFAGGGDLANYALIIASPETPPPPDHALDNAQDSPDSESLLPSADALLLGSENAQRLETARGHAERAVGAAGDWWDRIPSSSHPTIIGAAIVGLLGGLLIGTLAPAVSAMIVTGFTGAALVLTGFTMILARVGAVESPASGGAAPWLLLVWLVLSIIGLAVQWTFRPKPADRPA